jgi:hypothetical protein
LQLSGLWSFWVVDKPDWCKLRRIFFPTFRYWWTVIVRSYDLEWSKCRMY